MTAPVGVAWAPEPAHWSELKPGDVIEVGNALEIVTWIGSGPEGEPVLCTFGAGGQRNEHANPRDPDPLVLVLVRRDALVGQVLPPDPPG